MLVYTGMAADILEIFEAFRENKVNCDVDGDGNGDGYGGDYGGGENSSDLPMTIVQGVYLSECQRPKELQLKVASDF